MNQTDAINTAFESTVDSPCIRCRAPATLVGSFSPNDAEKFGGAPGKYRVIFYGLCEACAQEPDFEAIEEILSYSLTDKKITYH